MMGIGANTMVESAEISASAVSRETQEVLAKRFDSVQLRLRTLFKVVDIILFAHNTHIKAHSIIICASGLSTQELPWLYGPDTIRNEFGGRGDLAAINTMLTPVKAMDSIGWNCTRGAA